MNIVCDALEAQGRTVLTSVQTPLLPKEFRGRIDE
jgi:hypothetical protein